jgi:transposase
VADLYGQRGNPSVDPAVLMKLMLLLVYENVASERALMARLPERLDWLWFCGFDLDDTVPHHSVISKARSRWGVEVFTDLFEQVLFQCVEAGLVDGGIVHLDSSVIDADASLDRIRPALRLLARETFQQADEAAEAEASSVSREGPDPSTRISPTDPQARLITKHGKTQLGYKDHRAIDDAHGIITATETTAASTADAAVTPDLLSQHARHVGHSAETVVADSAYGKAEMYRDLHERRIRACIPRAKSPHVRGKFGREAFRYDPQQDCFICPAGETLRRYHTNRARQRIRYRADQGVCADCPLRAQCTDSKHGRRVERHELQAHVDWARDCFSVAQRRRLMGRRRCCAEGSFADAANNHGFKRARWRGLAKMRIQNLLVATCQNLRKLMRAVDRRARSAARAAVKGLVRLPDRCRRAFDRLLEHVPPGSEDKLDPTALRTTQACLN